MAQLKPFYEQIQAHYDLSDEFFALFLDPTMTYSCAYFEREDMTLEQAQLAKIDMSLDKCDLRPGQRLLDIGCGWGFTARRAAVKYRVDAIGLTLGRNQHRHASESVRRLPAGAGRVEFRLQGWEEFQEPVDAIVSIGAFEHFRVGRYPEFFARCRRLVPAGGRMLLHAIVLPDEDTLQRRGIRLTHADVLFAKFIRDRIFPGGQLCTPKIIGQHAERAGFLITGTQSLDSHYARTLDIWSGRLREARRRAVRLTSPEVYEDYVRYFQGCAAYFRSGHVDVIQFALRAR